jgi:hypothetical protein
MQGEIAGGLEMEEKDDRLWVNLREVNKVGMIEIKTVYREIINRGVMVFRGGIVAEVGSVTSKRNGAARYRFSHVIRAITKTSNKVSYEPTAITIRSDNSFCEPRVITIKSAKFSPQC